MSISPLGPSWLKVKSQFTRSVHIAKDEVRADDSYYPTQLALDVAAAVTREAITPGGDKAWTLTGPYGTGKSAFALFLVDILTNLESVHTCAQKIRVGSTTTEFIPLLPVLVQAASGPLEPSIRTTLKQVSKLRMHARESVHEMLERAANASDNGILLVVDELGKYLEFASRSNVEDLYFLQQIAEVAQRSRKPIVFLGILHSGFDNYLTDRNEVKRAEWLKVQGRFRDVPFLQPRDQILEVVAGSLENSMPTRIFNKYQKILRTATNRIDTVSPLEARVEESLAACAPLNPLTTLIMWAVFRSKIAQNERSIFAFLNTHEPYGFREFLQCVETNKRALLYSLADLFDYLAANLEMALSNGFKARQWLQIHNALERLPDDRPDDVLLVKTIGLLNLYGREAGVRSTRSTLWGALPNLTRKALDNLLASLVNESIVVFRRFDKSYRLWEGSDFDVETAFENSHASLVASDVCHRLKRLVNLRPFVARAHALRTGNVRIFSAHFLEHDRVSSNSMLSSLAEPGDGFDGSVVFLIADRSTPSVLEDLASTLSAQNTGLEFDSGDFPLWVAVPNLDSGIYRALEYYEAWQSVFDNNPELEGDLVAKKEVETRLNQAEHEFELIAGQVFGLAGHVFDPSRCSWYWRGDLEPNGGPKSAREFQELLSYHCAKVYEAAPTLFNETLNRHRLSSTGAAARRQLINLVLSRSQKNWFDADKFPPERGFFESILARGGFTNNSANEPITFNAPTEPSWLKVWHEIDRLLQLSREGPLALESLYTRLRQPPFGLKESVLPLLIALYARINEAEFALYEEGVFVPDVGEEVFERLQKRPDLFAVRRYSPNDFDRRLFKQLSAKNHLLLDGFNNGSVVSFVRSLLSFYGSLPKFSRLTNKLSNNAVAARQILINATDPYDLILRELPEALLGGSNVTDEASADEYANVLCEVIHEFDVAYKKLLDEIELAVRRSFCVGFTGVDLQRYLIDYFKPLVVFTERLEPLGVFLHSVINTEGLLKSDWRTEIGRTCRDGKPTNEWRDDDKARAFAQLDVFAEATRRLESGLGVGKGGPQCSSLSIQIANGSSSDTAFALSIPTELHEESQSILDSTFGSWTSSPHDRRAKIVALAKQLHDEIRSASSESI